MKVLFTRKTIVILSVALLISIITLVYVNLLNSGGPVTGLAQAVSRPLRSIATMIVRPFEGIYSSIYRYDALMEDYEKVL